MKLQTLSILFALLCLSYTYGQDVTYPSFGKGIKVMANDSSASMKINVRIQNLMEFNYDEMSNETTNKFMVRRQRLKFSGFAIDKDLRYKLELGFSNRDQGNSRTAAFGSSGSNIILDAVIKYYLFDNFDVWVGQTKIPSNRERVISSGDLQFVDRSLLNSNFNIDRDAGVQLRYKFGSDVIFKPTFAFTSGEGRNITATNPGGYAYTGHIDFLPFGEFESKKGDYISSDLNHSEDHKLSIGATYSFNDGTNRQGGQIGSFVYDTSGNLVANDMTSLFIDLQYKYQGISVMAEYVDKKVDENMSDITKQFLTGNSLNIQMGYLFRNYWEVSGRYTQIEPDTDFSAVKNLKEYTFGVSKYLKGHKLKVQSDISYFDMPTASTATDWRYRFQIELQL